MERVIKFRGKRLGYSEWLYFDMTHHLVDDEGVPPDFLQYQLDVKTVGQFTGLKDKNGKEIYEGDIVIATHYNYNMRDTIKTQEVYFENGCFCVRSLGNEIINPLQEDRNNVPIFWLQAPSTMEVIGNIHDNPELLKQ